MAKTSFIEIPNKGYNTPWGKSDVKYALKSDERIVDGVKFYATPSHGGFKVNTAQNKAIPIAFRNEDGWYEEDVEAAIVLFYLGADWTARATLRAWFPHEWHATYGAKVSAEESLVIAQEEFDVAHANDWVGVSAIYEFDTDETHHRYRTGYTIVTAAMGGKRSLYGHQKEFRVLSTDYADRGRFAYVIDLDKDVELSSTIDGTPSGMVEIIAVTV